MYRHYKYYIDRLITELKNPLKSDEWYYNLILFQFQQVLIKFILVSTCTEFERFATALSRVHCSNEDWALGDPANPKWLPRCLAAWLPGCLSAGEFKMAGVVRSIWIYGCSHRRVWIPPCCQAIFPTRITLVPYSLQAYIYAPRGLGLVRGEGKGVATPPNIPISNPPGPICTDRRGKGSILRILLAVECFQTMT